MISFQTYRTNIKLHVLKQFLVAAALIGVVIIYKTFISAKPNFSDSFYWIISILSLFTLIIEVFKNRLYLIQFDEEKEQIRLQYKSALLKGYTTQFNFKDTKIEVSEDTSILRWIKKSITLYFLKGKIEICSVSSAKDGYTYLQLKEICTVAQSITNKESQQTKRV